MLFSDIFTIQAIAKMAENKTVDSLKFNLTPLQCDGQAGGCILGIKKHVFSYV